MTLINMSLKEITSSAAYRIFIQLYKVRLFRELISKLYTSFFGDVAFNNAFYLGSKYLSDGDIILDIGAPDCLTHPLEKFQNNTIYAFEPLEDGYNNLVENTKFYKNVIPVNCALSDYEGTADLSVTNNRFSSSILPIDEKVLFESVGGGGRRY